MSERLLPVSVIIMTRNNAATLGTCLASLTDFDDIHIADSASTDETLTIAKDFKAKITGFSWNGFYPKKKQWCLENLHLKYDWVLYVDADEILTDEFLYALNRIDFKGPISGYFIKARHDLNGTILCHGMPNAKLALFKKDAFHYPAIDDLDTPGSFEVEGHYQPVPCRDGLKLGQINDPILHLNMHDMTLYRANHDLYAQWEAHMIHNRLYPADPSAMRQILKMVLRQNPLRPILIFIYSFIIKMGFLDGKAGYDYAMLKASYASNVLGRLRDLRRQ